MQSVAMVYLWLQKDDRLYEVNLVQINSQKDTMDLRAVKEDLIAIQSTVNEMNGLMKDKNISTFPTQRLDIDSLSHRVYLSNQINRYSQYLVDLERKLQQVPLGVPSEGYISSHFGKRVNPIPFIKKVFSSEKKALSSAGIPSVTSNATTTVAEVPKRRKVIDAKIVYEKDSAGNVKKVVVPIYAKEETPVIQRPETPRAVSMPTQIASVTKTASLQTKNLPPAEPEQMQFHKGVDFALPVGSPVRSTASGVVIFSGAKGGYGNCIIVSHGNGLATLYAHLSELLVKNNQKIKVNQIIAKSGNSGRSTGPHLHYEVHKDNTPVNPKLFMIQ